MPKGVAGKSSKEVEVEEARRGVTDSTQRRRNPTAFVPDTADVLIFGRDLDGAGEAHQQLEPSVAGKASLRVDAEARRRQLRDGAGKHHQEWVPESAGDVLFGHARQSGGSSSRQSPMRLHARDVAGKPSRDAAALRRQDARLAEEQRAANLVWLYTR
jgi:hypothetical protein